MADKPYDRALTRRQALRDMAALGGWLTASSLATAGQQSLSVPAAAAAAGDQLIVAVSATPVSLDPEFGASLESWELPILV